MASGKISMPALLVEPRDIEESFRLSCLAWCLKQLGGSVKIPREEVMKICMSGERIVMTGDVESDQISLSIGEASEKGGFTPPKKPADPKPAHFQRAETVIKEENE